MHSDPHETIEDGGESSARTLLGLMTGAWATQALRAAAGLRIADHLRDGPRSASDLATLTGAHDDSLGRLLKYLTSLGILCEAENGFGVTPLGQLLRTDVPDSMHALARLYGGAFYDSFGALEHTVRTGENAFEHVFGSAPFDYLADHPDEARMFDEAMAAGTRFIAAVPEVVDFSDVDLVVDVGGGVGDLLGRILTAHPRLRGVLLERDHVLRAAHTKLSALGCLDRCDLVAGDFTERVPDGGDVYVLSRILHDWPDETCRTILRACRTAMHTAATLLLIERPLPGNSAPSLARSWDMNMMVNNVGGRERTHCEYRNLLAAAGFELRDQRPLSIDLEVLVAGRADP